MKNTPLLLLHGALAEKRQFDSLASRLKNSFNIHLLNFEGHGDAKDADRPFRIEHFSDNVLTYLDSNSINKVNVFGYSMGGYVALYLAKIKPERIHKVATLGTVLEWNEEKAQSETMYLDPDKMEEKVPQFARQLAERHSVNWRSIVTKTRELLEHLGRNPSIRREEWRKLTQPVRLHVGDRDNTADLDSTHNVYKRLDHGDMAVFPRTPHPFNQVNLEWLMVSLIEFFHEKEDIANKSN